MVQYRRAYCVPQNMMTQNITHPVKSVFPFIDLGHWEIPDE